MKREQIISYFFIGIFLYIIYQLLLIFSPFMKAIFWAAVLSFLFYPIYAFLKERLKLRPSLAAFLTTSLIFFVVIFPALLISISALKEVIIDLYQKISVYISNGGFQTLIEKVRQIVTDKWSHDFGIKWESAQHNVSTLMLTGAQRVARLAAEQFTTISRNILLWLLNFFFTIVFCFFFIRNGESYYQFVYRNIPMTAKNKSHISHQLNETFSAVIRGQLLISTVQGFFTGIALWILGFPFPALFGFLAFFTSLIPTGAATIWVPFVIYAFIMSEVTRGLWLLGFGIIISLIDNVLKPILIGEKTKLPLILLFLGLLGGLKLYGFTGIFLGPIVLTLFFALLRIYREEYINEA